MEVINLTRSSAGATGINVGSPPDDREIFKSLHECVKDVGKFRQYLYYIGTSCDNVKLRRKIQKFKERIRRDFNHQADLMRRAAVSPHSSKNDLAVRRLKKCFYFTLASLNYYEDLLHKFSILLAYFPLPTEDSTNAVHLGFEDSTINADEVSFENHEYEDNETNRYIDLLNHIQNIQLLREEIEQINIDNFRQDPSSYSQEFVDNMHRYTTDLLTESNINQSNESNRQKFRYYLRDELSPSVG